MTHTFTPGQIVEILQAGAWIGPFTVTATTGGRTADHVILTGTSGPFELYADAPYNVRPVADTAATTARFGSTATVHAVRSGSYAACGAQQTGHVVRRMIPTTDAVTCKRCLKITDAADVADAPRGLTDAERATVATGIGARAAAHRTDADRDAADALSLLHGALYEGGASIWTGETADHGYLVGIPALAPTPNGREAYLIRQTANGARAALAAAWIGAWVPAVRGIDYVATIGSWRDAETDRIYFDASSHHATLEAASEAARTRGELAIWDVEHKCEIRTFSRCDSCHAEDATVLTVPDGQGEPVRACAACRAEVHAPCGDACCWQPRRS